MICLREYSFTTSTRNSYRIMRLLTPYMYKEQINQNACPRLLAVNMDALQDMMIKIKIQCRKRLSVFEGHFLNYMVQMR